MRTERFETFPKFLIVNLKRFSPQGEKKKQNVKCDATLKLYNKNSSPCLYEIFWSIEHDSPSMHVGHYTAISKASNTEFYNFNDDDVSKSK